MQTWEKLSRPIGLEVVGFIFYFRQGLHSVIHCGLITSIQNLGYLDLFYFEMPGLHIFLNS